MTTRRAFLAHAGTAAGALVLAPSAALAGPPLPSPALAARVRDALRSTPAAPAALAEDEAFWATVRADYALHPEILNLDHGWTNPTPRAAVDRLVQGARDLESLPADRLPRLWEEVTTTTVRAAVAAAMGVPPQEIALVRNATEALDTVLLGVPLAAGDEIVCSAHDYYAMLDALDQRRRRDGVVLRIVRPAIPTPSLDALAAAYEAAIGPRTRLVLLTHPSNLTGQLLPARRIADAAHRAGAEVVVDGAQSLGVLEDPVRALDCDYYGASMHKWLGAPVGMGALWMRPAHVGKVWPLVPSPGSETGMGRFEWIGTTPEYINPALLPALEVHQALGPARKAARLRYLAGHLRARVRAALPDARFYTRDDPTMSVGLTTIELAGRDHKLLQQRLLKEQRILVQAMVDIRSAPEIRGLRVSPNVYTTPAEIDRFVAALARLA
ncbi:MAG TPA: aminotransferase class V-fold PLP-dependent enzyme [Gemmatimonadaceae bacterium]|nr:aminotransferase class V-fold PLP-dependent enzyme [Gemmatimonadaceae bacterium]